MEFINNLCILVISLVCIFIVPWLWKVLNWVWLKPKKLEKCIRKQAFQGNSYRVLYGDTKEIATMVKETTSKPMDHFSNDYIPRVFPFHYQIMKNYGEKSFVWDGPIPSLMITNPEEIREILMKIYDFKKIVPTPLIKRLTNGLVRLEGSKWAKERKLLNPAFHMEKLKHMIPAFNASCKEMIKEWEKIVSKTGSGEVEMWSYLHNMSADAISRAAFGSSFQEGQRVFELLREHTSITVQALQSVYIPGSRFLPTNTNRREAKIIKEMESLLKAMIQRRQNAIKNGEDGKDDLLDLLLTSSIEDNHLKDGNSKEHVKLGMKEIIEECKMFYIAGQETTSSLLTWTLILLSKHQDWQHQAREEILATFGDTIPNDVGLNQLKKVNMILQEVLRLYPPVVTLGRKVSHDMKVGNMDLPAGVQVKLPTIFIHHSEKLWGKDAKEFNPNRFSQGLLKATGGNMCFFAFGWGPRICIGSNFALLEAKMALALILPHFSLELSPSYAHAPTIGQGTLRPQFGAKLILHRINNI
ncbi:cytochrome P450 CYP72A219-like [Amaranthus tricolor]|uniref:cytochrome P450 CYP72A219-like n=1 Tax=Amaranthus tricolor TaxID=29722 RepID=UPI00258FCA50|nr:cytochrome P450 CYP72A219-like [Amaranthus tricolor]